MTRKRDNEPKVQETKKPCLIFEFYKPGWGREDGFIALDPNNVSLSVQLGDIYIGSIYDRERLRKLARAILELVNDQDAG